MTDTQNEGRVGRDPASSVVSPDSNFPTVSDSTPPLSFWSEPIMHSEAEFLRTVRAQLNLDDHLNFVQDICRSDEQFRLKVEIEIERIRSREKDTHLFLGVVGEFNAGKSTLINAILRRNILRADIFQQCTAACTEIRFGPLLGVEVRFSDRETTRFFLNESAIDEQQLISHIQELTSEEDIAKDIDNVVIFHPAPILADGLVIVDTPGINVDNKRHVAVTQRAIREICDAAIVVIPADIPLPQTLCAFLHSNLADVLHRCLFAVTKMDHIRPRDWEKHVGNIKARLAKSLGLNDPQVLPCAPSLILDELTGESGQSRLTVEEVIGLKNQFLAMEAALNFHLRRQRIVITVEKLSMLLSDVLDKIESSLACQSEEVKNRHQALLKNQIPDLEEFIENQKAKHQSEFQQCASWTISYLSRRINELKQSFSQSMLRAIWKASKASEIKMSLTDQSPHLLKQLEDNCGRELTLVNDFLEFAARRQESAFRIYFIDIYKQLITLGGKIPKDESQIESMLDLATAGAPQVSDSPAAEIQIARGSGKIAAGAGIVGLGAVLLLGPLGLVLGPILGAIIGGLFNPALEQQKKSCWNQMSEKIGETFSQFETEVKNRVKLLIEERSVRMAMLIDSYFAMYETAAADFAQQTRKDEEDLRRLESKIAGNRHDIRTRQNLLEQLRQKMRRA